MAILQMKRLRLMILRSKKEALLQELTKRGCVQLTELDEEARELLRPAGSELMALKSEQAAYEKALALLGRYAPAKSPLLSAKPELPENSFLEKEGEESLALARKIADADERIRHIAAEESRRRGVIESLQPWLALDLPLETAGTERAALVFGTLPLKGGLAPAEQALAEAVEEAELFPVSQDKKEQYVLLLCTKEYLPAAQEALRGQGFNAVSFGGLTGTAKEAELRECKALEELAAEKAALAEEIKSEAGHRDELKLACDRLNTRVGMAEAEEHLAESDSVIFLEGWMPAEKEEELAGLFAAYDCAWECEDPSEEEYAQVPVKLRNNKFSNALNMVTDMYSLPAYGSVDANPIMAPFFILFYGLMMADMGYGLIMIAAALVAMKKIKPRGGTLAFCQLLLYGGISTFIMGALTGGFFGNAPEIIAGMFGSSWKGLPHLFSPVEDSNMVLYGAMVLGVLHLNTGMAVSFVQKCRKGDVAGALFEEGSQWIILVGGVMLALQMLVFKTNGTLHTVGLAVLIAGAVLLLFGSTRGAKGIGKLTAPFGCIYNTLTGWFGDILSYSRIMALMLAGGVVAQVFNTIAAMPSKNGVTIASGIAFILIFLIGHALNFALNLLGCFVHDLRLQCLEFFGKFYQDGGKPFEPMKVRTKYINPEE